MTRDTGQATSDGLHEPGYCLGTFARDEDGQPTYRGHIELDEAEYRRYAEATKAALTLSQRLGLQFVIRNHRTLQSLRSHYEARFAAPNERERIDPRDAGLNLMSAVVNWLSSFRLYLDHQATEYTRRYGADSDEFLRFERATNAAFDRSPAYRIISRFRNYVQHCGLPFSHVGLDRDESGATVQRIAFWVDRDDLLADFDWTRAREDLRAQPARVDVLTLIDEAMAELLTVSRTALRIDLERAWEGLPLLRNALERLGAFDGAPILLLFRGGTGDQLNFSHLPLLGEEDLARLAEAENAPDPVGALLSSDDHPGAAFPEYTEDQRDQLRRGISAMSTWREEGGMTPRLASLIDEIVEQDRGIQPLIGGMFLVSAFLLALAEAATGLAPHSILGDLTAALDEQAGS